MFLVPHIPRSCLLLWGDGKRNCCPEIRYGVISLDWFTITGIFFHINIAQLLRRVLMCDSSKGILLAHTEEKISHLGFKLSQSFDKLCKTIKLNSLWLIKANYIHFNSVGEPQFRNLLFFPHLAPLVNSSEHFRELLFRQHLYINSSLIIHH